MVSGCPLENLLNVLSPFMPVPLKGGGGHSPGPRGAKRHSVAAEIHPGGKKYLTVSVPMY